jgi:CHASE2 domain-containing sensor protein
MKKPLHKHIGHRLKRSHVPFTKYLYERDTIFATIWVFLFIIGLSSLPINLGFLNPIKLGLKDFDFNDISYSKLGKTDKDSVDERIVIVNVDREDREGLSYMIDKVAAGDPKVIGLDVLFGGPLDESKDSLLSATISKHKNLVYAVKFQLDSSDRFVTDLDYFKTAAHNSGYVNFPTIGDLETIRSYFPFKISKDTSLNSFSSAIIKLYDTTAFKKLKQKGDHATIINYTRTAFGDGSPGKYLVIQPEELLNDNYEASRFKDNIVLLAFMSRTPYDIEDKKFTPMNEKYAGKSHPDMNGIVVHANIISMVLDDNYIKKVPLWVNLLIAVLVCWLHMSFFIRYYLESHIWFHLVAKIAQVLSAIFFVWLGIYLFDKYRLKVDLKLSIVVIVLAVDVIYFYEAFAVWMNKKFGFKTIFHQKHH